mgnify:CR=1 FL=1
MLDALKDAMASAAEELERMPERVVQLFHHNDADGLTSGAILTRAFERKGFEVRHFCLEKPYPAVLEKVYEQEGKIIVFADFAGRIAPLLSELNQGRNLTLILDHHIAEPSTDARVLNLDPDLFGLKGDRDISGSATGYLFSSKWGTPGTGNGQFGSPRQIALDRVNGWLYVADELNNRIQKFDRTGNFIILWGNFGAANANFHNPTGIACDAKGDVYVVDTNNHRVQKFDGKLGGYLMKFGSRGNGEGQFNAPWGIAIDRVRGYIYVVDSANFRVQKFDMSGEFIMSWGSFGNGDGQFYFPRGIAVDQADGTVYVVDMGNHRVQKFDTSTNVLPQLLTKWGGSSEACLLYTSPSPRDRTRTRMPSSA